MTREKRKGDRGENGREKWKKKKKNEWEGGGERGKRSGIKEE